MSKLSNFPIGPISVRILYAATLIALPNVALTHSLAAQESEAEAAIAENGDATAQAPTWYFEESDIPVDPGYTFGVLENGMRYVLRENATPEGTALVRMRIDSGSLDETADERGLSHFLEHMAFNGSAGIPEGEMVALLEREGLAFGADTNASTGLNAITYMLNLPRNDEELLGTALMLMRETASELTIAQDAVDRERGVVLAERRDRRGFAQRAREDGMEFTAPGARFIERLPIGTLESLETASAEQLRGLYERTYTPRNTVLVIVGDIPVPVMEAAIRERFSDWTGPEAPEDPITGPIDPTRQGLTDIYLDPALSESVSISVLGEWIDVPDTLTNRQDALLRGVGFGIISRRLSRLARGEDAPFRRAGYGGSNLFEDARSFSINISSEDGKWRDGVLAAVREVNQALTYGFTQAEVDEQIANIRTSIENRVAGAETRSNGGFANAALNLVANDVVPTVPEFQLELFNAVLPSITPDAVHTAVVERALPFNDPDKQPLIRFQGRTAPEGGEEGLRAAFDAAMALPIAAPLDTGSVAFAYTDFGLAGSIVSDTTEERLGFRYITFANGVRLTLKKTDIREDRISFRMSVDGGSLLNTRDDPLRTYLIGSVPSGGLGQHSADELQSVLAGRSVGVRLSNAPDVFSFTGGTTPRDLTLQMQLLTAGLTDPGYRREGLERFRQGIDNFFETLRSTPGRAYGTQAGAILSGGDPRFSLQTRDEFYALDYEKLEAAIGDRWANGAIEIALVGDFEEDDAIAAVAQTIGALPSRESEFLPRTQERIRAFTSDRGEHILRHQGEADQALVRLVWPTTDDSDFAKAMRVSLLARVFQIQLTDRLREELGQAYSPRASSSMSRIYPDYGSFTVSASVDVDQVGPTRDAIAALVDEIRNEPIDPDVIDRARAPLLEAYDNALKSLGGWMGLADRVQSEGDRLERWFIGPDMLRSITADDIQGEAQQYLSIDSAVQFLVLPEESDNEDQEGGEQTAP
ncbi:insulinase family protein [Erythrobacter sp. Alg231-14]|uniref:insulinase family protein n=1 Tax=Erythrobacter sp. Alg231-14 TaxID=1922225 RepID=UPI000D55F206